MKQESQEAVTELSGEEAFRLISGQRLTYADAPQYFKRWWNSIDPATQQEINVIAEDFEDLNDYQWKCFTSSGGPVMNATKDTVGIKTLYAQMQAGMPKIDEAQFTSLWMDAVQRRKILKRGRERSAVKCFIEDYLGTMRQVLYRTFGITANRPRSDQNRDRYFSKRSYQGLTPREIAREWNRKHRKSDLAVSPATVAKGITRYRQKRERVMWLLRLWIYRGNFPKLTARTCPQCAGKGEIYFADRWRAWYKRRVDQQDWRSVPTGDPEPLCPPPERCDVCGGTGIRGVKRQQ